jgi:hypothetical protein
MAVPKNETVKVPRVVIDFKEKQQFTFNNVNDADADEVVDLCLDRRVHGQGASHAVPHQDHPRAWSQHSLGHLYDVGRQGIGRQIVVVGGRRLPVSPQVDGHNAALDPPDDVCGQQ